MGIEKKIDKYLNEVIDTDKMADKVRKLHDKAKPEGKMKHGGKTYYFFFDRRQGVYIVTQDDIEVTRLNTRKITVAKKWLKEYLEN